jgi:hypothetical protein
MDQQGASGRYAQALFAADKRIGCLVNGCTSDTNCGLISIP